MKNLYFHVSNCDHKEGIFLGPARYGNFINNLPLHTGNREKCMENRLNVIIELIFEQIRKEMGLVISRFNCHFAFRDVKSAEEFKNKFRNGHGKLYQILVDDKIPTFIGDFNLISYDNTSVLKITENAKRYWSGEQTSEFVEVLIGGPIEIFTRTKFPKI